jgi:hypothetical protein
MNKKIVLIILLLACSRITFAQVAESEKIDWENLPAFSCKSFVFKTNQLKYECKDCRFVTLKSNSGESGYFLLGPGRLSIPEKKIEASSSAIMIRLNPKDSADFLQIANAAAIEDKGFVSLSLLILNNIFRRFYHSGMDALIPNKGEYGADIFSDKDGDIAVSYADGNISIFNLTKKRNQ